MERKEIEEKVNNLDGNDKAYASNYFIKRSMLDNLFDKVRMQLKRDSFGNANAKVMFIVDFDSTGDKNIWLIKEFFIKNGYSPYNVYFTPLRKTEDENLNNAILQKEIEIINPNRVIVINDTNIRINCQSKFLSVNDMNNIINRKTSNIDQTTFKISLSKLSSVMEYAILGK